MYIDCHPYLSNHICFRKYDEINIYDLKSDESFIIDNEAFELLKLANGKNTKTYIINQYVKPKQADVIETLDFFIESNIIRCDHAQIEPQSPNKSLNDDLYKENPTVFPYLKNLMLNITEKCNLSCKHCYITSKNPIDFKLDKLKDIISVFFDLQGIKLVLTGGEPFLYSQLEELLEFLLDYPLQKEMLSNGMLISKNPKIVDLLKKNHFNVYVSVDGLERTHDDFRDANCFQSTLEGIKYLLKNEINTSINTMVHKQNLNEFPELFKLVKSLGTIKNWSVDVPTFDKNTPSDIVEKYQISPEEGGKILNEYGWGVIYESESNNYCCGPNLMAIDVSGVITKCGFFYEQNVGNIHDLGLKKGWELIQKKLNWPFTSLKCQEINCEFLEECRGGCRYRAFRNTGDVLGVDAFKCEQFGKSVK
ncbi:MAG: radical SAM protein [Candidatus Lokiarchaeota archaeon]|nr:radical SAM protein [Candidatus Lokiarchaeota archaeon]